MRSQCQRLNESIHPHGPSSVRNSWIIFDLVQFRFDDPRFSKVSRDLEPYDHILSPLKLGWAFKL